MLKNHFFLFVLFLWRMVCTAKLLTTALLYPLPHSEISSLLLASLFFWLPVFSPGGNTGSCCPAWRPPWRALCPPTTQTCGRVMGGCSVCTKTWTTSWAMAWRMNRWRLNSWNSLLLLSLILCPLFLISRLLIPCIYWWNTVNLCVASFIKAWH